MKKGKFIVIDGCDGAGKGTQIEFLKKMYPDALYTREPGGSPYGEEIRAVILKSPNAKQASALTHLCLFFAARHDHIKNIIAPALARGQNVISDRFDSSTFAFQYSGMQGEGLLDLFFMLREICLGDTTPDLYLFLDVDPKESMKRTAARAGATGETNHFDERAKDFHARIRDGYLEFQKRFSDSVKVVDANGDRETVWKNIQQVLEPILNK